MFEKTVALSISKASESVPLYYLNYLLKFCVLGHIVDKHYPGGD